MTDAQNASKATAMPQQPISPLQTGASSPAQSAIMTQKLQTDQQIKLIKGGRRKRRYRGGNAIIVPAPPPGSVNQSETTAQYASLTKLAEQQASQAVYDKGNTATVASTQKGGSWPVWSCLSGGRRTKRKRRGRKTRRRKTRRHMRRH